MSAPIVLEAPVPLKFRERLCGLAAVGTAQLILTATRGRRARIRAVLRILRTGARPAGGGAFAVQAQLGTPGSVEQLLAGFEGPRRQSQPLGGEVLFVGGAAA
jgi:hypothetical protein